MLTSNHQFKPSSQSNHHDHHDEDQDYELLRKSDYQLITNQTIQLWNPSWSKLIYLSLSLLILKLIFILNLNQTHHTSSNFNRFKSLDGWFIQSDLKTNPIHFNVYGEDSSFGLVDRMGKHHWRKFDEKIQKLNQKKSSKDLYKVIFIARHGEGFHNLAESKYGTPMWDCYWSELNGDQNLTWGPDSRLSSKGKHQIQVAKHAWKREISQSLPIPSLFITSPLSRAIETMEITSVWNVTKNQGPEVREGWRENIGLHTCDLRRSQSEIQTDYRFLRFEDGFHETDQLWTKEFQETSKQLDLRIHKSLERLFNDPIDQQHIYVSITTHSGVINSLLRVIGHRPFPTQTGGMIPLVIKGSRNPTPTRPPSPGPSATKPDCPQDLQLSV